MRLLTLVSVMLCATAPAVAQDISYDFSKTTSCLAEKGNDGEAHQCFGDAAADCMEQSAGGWSTAGMIKCLGAEVQDWDKRLNTAYGILMTRLKADDAEMRALGSAAPSRADALKKMQRAWIPFRDSSCEYERSHWAGGTGGSPASLSCYLTLTATQAWSLERDAVAYEAASCNHEGCTE